MNNDIDYQEIDERIERFLRGEMNTEEEIAFKKEVKSNPELRNRALTMSSLIKQISANVKEHEEKVLASVHKRQYRWRNVACVASVAAVLLLLFTLYPNKSTQFSLEPYYEKYDVASISRGDTDSATVAELYAMFEQIKKNDDVSQIIKKLEPIYASLDDDFTYHPFANDIAWNLALAYIKDNQKDKAIPILEKLEADNREIPIAAKAQGLLKKLQEK